MKKELLAIALSFLAVTTMGYSLINNDFDLSNVVNIHKNTFSVPLENVKVDEENTTLDEKNIEIIQTDDSLYYSVNLEKPGDTYAFDIDIANNGTIDAVIENISVGKLTASQEKYLEYKVTYKDGSEIKNGDIIEAHTTKTIHISISMKEDINAEDLPTENENLDLGLEINIIQK